VLRTIVSQAEQNVGVYANVVRPGTLDAGAPVTLL
jgi:MOSC domain-containing protein YiiM